MSTSITTNDWCEELAAHRSPWAKAKAGAKVSVTPKARSVTEITDELRLARHSWACFASSVRRCIDGRWYNVTERTDCAAPSVEDCSRLLNAELVQSETRSIHVSRVGNELRCVEIEDGGGKDAISLEDTFVSTERDGSRDWMLHYRTYWTQHGAEVDGVTSWKPYVSRFLGWRLS